MMDKKLKVPLIALGILWIIVFAGYMWETFTPKVTYTIDEGNNLECKETWDGDRLVERECQSKPFDYIINADELGMIAGTGSMLPFMDENDLMYYRNVGENEMLWQGRIYVYRVNETRHIIHRLISNYFGEDGEEYLIFKGDNSVTADQPILREQVEKELVGVCLNGYCKE